MAAPAPTTSATQTPEHQSVETRTAELEKELRRKDKLLHRQQERIKQLEALLANLIEEPANSSNESAPVASTSLSTTNPASPTTPEKLRSLVEARRSWTEPDLVILDEYARAAGITDTSGEARADEAIQATGDTDEDADESFAFTAETFATSPPEDSDFSPARYRIKGRDKLVRLTGRRSSIEEIAPFLQVFRIYTSSDFI